MSNLIIQGLVSQFIVSQGYESATGLTATLTGPDSGTINIPSLNFSISLNGMWTGTFLMDDVGAGGSFNPSELTWSSESTTKTFTYTPIVSGNIFIEIKVKP